MNNRGFKSDWLATVRGRAGWAWDRVLLFGTGGAHSLLLSFPGLAPRMTGRTAGGGVEAAFAPNWTAKVEYLYVDFPNPDVAGVSAKVTDNVVRAGINYKFNW